ncbi:ABC transporter substrate-binding protein [Alsobacter sp. KACC 23698]|uniref:ABC transporter substrate-binding protein n=1 Tax=Alsobacter sp. KACC 23698 TaxID=3149229 RepID=A0AAU7JLX1_9HYPH
MRQRQNSGLNRRHFVAAAAAATLSAPAIVRAQAPVLKVGVMLPRSGFFAQAGQSCHRGALAAPKVLADLGYKVELVHIDTESSADIARTQAERAVNDGVHCLVGAFDSGHTLAIAQVAEQRQVPLICNIAAAPQLTEQGYKYLVRNFQTGGALVTNGLRLIKTISEATKVDFKSAVFLHANDTFGTAQRQAMDAIFPKQNMPFPLTESIAYDPKAQDLSVEVTKMRSLNPDLVMVVSRAGDAIKLVRDMVRQRFEPKAIISPGSPGLYDEEFYQALGPLADYLMFNLPWANPKSDMTQALEASFKQANPNNRFAVDCFNAGFTFEAILVAADAFKRAGATAGPALMDAVRQTKIEKHVMIGGPIQFDEKGNNPNIGSAAVQNRGRTPTVVLPSEVATEAPVLPMPSWQGRK